MRKLLLVPLVALVLSIPARQTSAEQPSESFRIRVVDEETGRGVPLVELKTVNESRYYTDSAGCVAFDEPGLMDQTVFFHVSSHGYEFPKDGFGMRGKALRVEPGGSAELTIRRINVAERLYRVTGAGIYRDSILLGDKAPAREPLLNGQVFGSDSVVNAVYRGRIHWFWGDTSRPSYPLGNFHTSGATSRLPRDGGLAPDAGVDLEYFRNEDGFAREMARMPGEGPTWIGGLVVLRDGGRERMFAGYHKIRGFVDVYERGLTEFDDRTERFEKVHAWDDDVPARAGAHTFLHTDDGVEYVYFAHPFPLTRVRATPEALKDPAQYETFTCLRTGSRRDEAEIERDTDGLPRYTWKRGAAAVGPDEQIRLLRSGDLKPEEALLPVRDAESGRPIKLHSGSVYWNEHRSRWILVAVEQGGEGSELGEIWYAEADTPVGPWAYAIKIVTHDRYSFYNPKQHPMFDQDGGRVVYFEGTYTALFSGVQVPTPRYDYNQIMYRLDLDHPRLQTPVAICGTPDRDGRARYHAGLPREPGRSNAAVAFFAHDRARPATVPVYEERDESGGTVLRAGTGKPELSSPPAAFHALPADSESSSPDVVPLHEFVHEETGERRYSTNARWPEPGYVRNETPVCRVWRPLSDAHSAIVRTARP